MAGTRAFHDTEAVVTEWPVRASGARGVLLQPPCLHVPPLPLPSRGTPLRQWRGELGRAVRVKP
jgi:hypothetical protein